MRSLICYVEGLKAMAFITQFSTRSTSLLSSPQGVPLRLLCEPAARSPDGLSFQCCRACRYAISHKTASINGFPQNCPILCLFLKH